MENPDLSIEDEFRAFMAGRGVTIDAEPAKPKRQRWRDVSLKQKLCAIYAIAFIGTVAPIVIGLLSLVALGTWDAMTGH